MAQRRSGNKTSFGKKTSAEKAFTRRRGKPESEESGDRKERPERKPGEFSKFSKKPFSKRSEGYADRPEGKSRRSPSGRSYSKSDDREARPERRPGKFSKKSYSKGSEGYSDRPERKGGRPAGKSFPKSDSREGRSEKGPGFFKKSFSKRSDGYSGESESKTSRSTDKRYPKSDRPFTKRNTSSLGFTKRAKGSAKKSARPQGNPPEAKNDGLTRLNKYIANAGMGSRREADEMIKLGLISVNGTVITEMGFKVKAGDVVRYEDKILNAEKPVYLLLNKPKGFITTTVDPQERKTVMSLVASACKERIYPVGRLDRNTTGLLLLTNDGELAEKLTHPSYNVKKIYRVELDKPLTRADFQKIQDGVRLEEGRAIVDDLAYVDESKKVIGMELHIGWNRIVRRIFESLAYEVVKLDRVVYAGLDKKDLPRGAWRFLKPEEIIRLKHFK